MRRQTEAQKDAMYDFMMEQRERAKRLDEKGLCHECEDNPQNPGLSAPVCVECFESSEFSCMKNGCPNSAAGEYRQGRFCEPHLIATIHSAYEDYLELKAEVQDRQKELEEVMGKHDYDPSNTSIPPRDRNDTQKEIDDKKIEVKMAQRELSSKKRMIQQAMKSVDEAFPDNYSTSI